ncbi:MAG: site-specific integrase [Clostridia bacterium]|jgi:integrase|nr:site-specific integrase [Clostridia bacterium]
MAKKNANGDGSIYKRSDGLWCANISLGYNSDGTRKRKVIYDRDRKTLKEKMIDLQNDIAINDGYIRDDEIRLQQWARTYLDEFIKPTVREGTYDSYDVICRNHIFNSNIASMKLKDIKAYNLQAFMNTKTNMSKSYIKKIHLLLNTFFENAVKNELIRKNPMIAVNKPSSKKEEKEIEVLTLDEQKSYMANLNSTSYKPLLLTALFTGMRLGEIIALTWNNTDLVKKEIKVINSFRLTRIHDNEKPEWKMIKQPPKTKSSIRRIPIPDMLVNELKLHKKKQSEKSLKLGVENFNTQGLVFCSETGTPLTPRNVQRAHYLVCEKAKVNPQEIIKDEKTNISYGVGFHALRHTFATRMIESKVDVKTVQDWLGHSTIQMTYNIYVHVQEQTKKAAADVQNDLFKSLL